MGTRVVRCEEGSVGLHVLPRGVGEGRGRVGEGKGEHNKMHHKTFFMHIVPRVIW